MACEEKQEGDEGGALLGATVQGCIKKSMAVVERGWGGLCVHFQAMSLWQTAGLRPHGYFSAKLLHGLLSAVLALACFAPSPAALLSAGALTACALLAPLLRKIRAGNLRPAAV